jgi:uncharacterized protein (TIGR00661 family)
MKILFGVFDWGLGHATRDTPLIEELLKRKHKVEIISTGNALKLLQNHFKKRCKYHDVPSLYYVYNYKRFFKLHFTKSIPKIVRSLSKAREISSKIIKREKYDRVISDCRYDVYDTPENSYLINHQLRFKAPPIAERVLELFLSSRAKKYRYILVPDFEKSNLTGRLAHDLNYIPQDKIKYIGIISHVKKINLKEDIDYFISLSGPDQTKKRLEEKILLQIKHLKGKIVIAGGNPNKEKNISNKSLKFYSFLNSKQQEKMMNRAKFVIIRAGYTTIMELVELEKQKTLLIPSPGQTEQEYLVRYYKKQGYFYSVSQYNLNLKKDIEKSKKVKGFRPPWKTKDSVKKFCKIIFS